MGSPLLILVVALATTALLASTVTCQGLIPDRDHESGGPRYVHKDFFKNGIPPNPHANQTMYEKWSGGPPPQPIDHTKPANFERRIFHCWGYLAHPTVIGELKIYFRQQPNGILCRPGKDTCRGVKMIDQACFPEMFNVWEMRVDAAMALDLKWWCSKYPNYFEYGGKRYTQCLGEDKIRQIAIPGDGKGRPPGGGHHDGGGHHTGGGGGHHIPPNPPRR